MKSEILEILRMQEQGKLTQDQAAELLAALADQAREKGGAPGNGGGGTQGTPSEGAPGPQGGAPGGGSASTRRDPSTTASAAIHEIVDAAIGMGVTVGRAATVWGGELVNMVHREQDANTITLSRVDPPAGSDYTFRNNTVNVSKISALTLNQSEFTGNSLNASKLSNLTLTAARFSHCTINGSSLTHVVIEGPAQATAPSPGANQPEPPPAGIRNCNFSATKVTRLRVSGGSTLDACAIKAAAFKDSEISNASTLKDCRFDDSAIAALHIDHANCTGLILSRSGVSALSIQGARLDRVTFTGWRIAETRIAGGTWTNITFSREGPSLLQESAFENCTLTDCQFAGCTFRRTTLRNLNLTGICIRNIDFTGMVLETEESFRRAAGI